MRFRVRTWDGEQPLPGLDVTCSSALVMIELAEERAENWGWGNVSMAEHGERPIKGAELEQHVKRLRESIGATT